MLLRPNRRHCASPRRPARLPLPAPLRRSIQRQQLLHLPDNSAAYKGESRFPAITKYHYDNELSSSRTEYSLYGARMNPEALQAVALAVAAETSVDRVLAQIVDGLVAHTAVALARVWLIGAGDICETCPLHTECPDQTRCLHLAASAGVPLDGRADWTRLDGAFRRFPIGVRKIGRIGATGDGIFIEDVARDHDWIAHPDWVRRERISSFGGQPLVFNG